jgi:hypothetical protein
MDWFCPWRKMLKTATHSISILAEFTGQFSMAIQSLQKRKSFSFSYAFPLQARFFQD